MNTADLVMNYSSVSALAKEIGTMQEEFSELLVNLGSLVETVNGKWKGKAQVEFATAYDNLRPKLEMISAVLKNYETALAATAADQANLEEAHAKMLSYMGIPSF